MSLASEDGPRLHTGRQDTGFRVNVRQIGPQQGDALFEVENVPADLCPFGAENGNNVFALAPNLAADPIHFLGRFRHNIVNKQEVLPLVRQIAMHARYSRSDRCQTHQQQYPMG